MFFFLQFTKTNSIHDLLCASLVDEAFPNGSLHLEKRICSRKSKFFSLRVDLLRKEESNEKSSVTSTYQTLLFSRALKTVVLLQGKNAHKGKSKHDMAVELLVRITSPGCNLKARIRTPGGPYYHQFYKLSFIIVSLLPTKDNHLPLVITVLLINTDP